MRVGSFLGPSGYYQQDLSTIHPRDNNVVPAATPVTPTTPATQPATQPPAQAQQPVFTPEQNKAAEKNWGGTGLPKSVFQPTTTKPATTPVTQNTGWGGTGLPQSVFQPNTSSYR